MREYIFEKIDKTPNLLGFANVEIIENDPVPAGIDLKSVFKTLERTFPPHYFKSLESIVIGHLDEFSERNVNAVYRDKSFYITNQQRGVNDLIDDIVHEFAHHLEILYPENIYSDKSVIDEFLKKRHELEFELRTEGYWTDEYDFNNLKYDQAFDDFLYKRVGRRMLQMVTAGIFIRPYAAVSLREYFATGFEAYYLGKEETLDKISPRLYDKIFEIHHLNG